MGGFMNFRGVAAKLGVGTRLAVNTGGVYPRIHYVSTFENPPIVPTANASCTLVTTVAAAVGDTALTIVAVVAATLAAQPRSLAIWADAAQTENCEFTGTDQFGVAQTETIAFNGAAKVETTKVWGSITLITQKARAPGAANIAVGLGSIFGTARKLVGVIDGYVFVTATGKYAAVRETTEPLKTTTANVHGVTFTTAIAATNTYELHYISDETR